MSEALRSAFEMLRDDTIERHLASGGDTDTVACIVGALVGARHGRPSLRVPWLEGLSSAAADACARAAAGLAALGAPQRASAR